MTNTGENVRFGRAKVAEVIDLAAIHGVVVVGKICSTRRDCLQLHARRGHPATGFSTLSFLDAAYHQAA